MFLFTHYVVLFPFLYHFILFVIYVSVCVCPFLLCAFHVAVAPPLLWLVACSVFPCHYARVCVCSHVSDVLFLVVVLWCVVFSNCMVPVHCYVYCCMLRCLVYVSAVGCPG